MKSYLSLALALTFSILTATINCLPNIINMFYLFFPCTFIIIIITSILFSMSSSQASRTFRYLNKKNRFILDNTHNRNGHRLEKLLNKILLALAIIESQHLLKDLEYEELRKKIHLLSEKLLWSNVEEACNIAESILNFIGNSIEDSKLCGPLVVKGKNSSLTIYGFMRSCNPGTTIAGLISCGYLGPSLSGLEFDLKAAYEQIEFTESHLSIGSSLFPITFSLVGSILNSSHVVRLAKKHPALLNSPERIKRWHKQYPGWSSLRNSFTFKSSCLIQGSPMSPILFNLFLCTLLDKMLGDWVVYGDNFYSHPYHPSYSLPIPGYHWKNPVLVKHGTLGLKFNWINGKLAVYHSYGPYKIGTQRAIDCSNNMT